MSFVDPVPFETAENIAVTITAMPGVAGLWGGFYGEIALLYPSHRITGMRLIGNDTMGTGLEIDIVADLDTLPATQTVKTLSEAIRIMAEKESGLVTNVIVADVVAQQPITQG